MQVSKIFFCGFFLIVSILLGLTAVSAQKITIGSKHFNESYILAEIIAQLLSERGYDVETKSGLGGTLICYEALKNGEIDIYPEYSGTIGQAILKLENRVTFTQLQSLLKKERLELLDSFGFNNTYALALDKEKATRLNLTKISDLKKYPDLKFGFSYEYLERGDGWGALSDVYRLSQHAVGMEHGLAYQALAEGSIDATDVYSTDAEIRKYDLLLLQDDFNFFPKYLAAPLVRSDLADDVKHILNKLAGKIDETTMQRLNAEVAIANRSFSETAQTFLFAAGLIKKKANLSKSVWQKLLPRLLRHILLTGIALAAAILLAIPGGIFIYRKPGISRPIIYISGLLQTIPSIALLAFMIPFFGIGVKPAIIALILYAILPILRNTYVALNSVDPLLKKVSLGMGLTSSQRLRHIELPLAMPNILAGVSTAAVISIGTATLAAFIGAGGLGEPIVTGLALNDPYLIMEGAIPAAALAILLEFGFRILERLLIPQHLLQKHSG